MTLRFSFLKRSCLTTVAILSAMAAAEAFAQNVALRARGSGDNGDGSQFAALGKYGEQGERIRNIFKIRRGLPQTDHVFCVSSDECSFSAVLTTNDRGRAKVKYDSRDGSLPEDFPRIAEGDFLIVNGEALDHYRRPD